MPYEEKKLNLLKQFFRYWYLQILALLSAFFLWLYVNITDKEAFQWEIPIKSEIKVFPNYVYITGKVVSRLKNPEVFRKHIKISLIWDKDKKSAEVVVKSDIPKLFLEIDSYYPKRVNVSDL